MLKQPKKVRELEAAYDRRRYASMSIEERRARYASMRSLAARFARPRTSEWRKEIEADLRVGKILNSQPSDD